MKFDLNLNALKEIYLVANTAAFLFSNFSGDQSIIDVRRNCETQDIINEFKAIGYRGIQSIDDLVYAYGLFIAILLKQDTKTDCFLKNEGASINYEWFPELSSIYFDRMRPISMEVIDLRYKYDHPNNSLRTNSEYHLEQIEL